MDCTCSRSRAHFFSPSACRFIFPCFRVPGCGWPPLLLFCNLANTAYFNSFYLDALPLLALLAVAICARKLPHAPSTINIVCFTAASLVLVSSNCSTRHPRSRSLSFSCDASGGKQLFRPPCFWRPRHGCRSARPSPHLFFGFFGSRGPEAKRATVTFIGIPANRCPDQIGNPFRFSFATFRTTAAPALNTPIRRWGNRAETRQLADLLYIVVASVWPHPTPFFVMKTTASRFSRRKRDINLS